MTSIFGHDRHCFAILQDNVRYLLLSVTSFERDRDMSGGSQCEVRNTIEGEFLQTFTESKDERLA